MTTMLRALPIISLFLLLGCSVPGGNTQGAQNAGTPGWTGRTQVIGSTSTVAGDAEATYNQQKWQYNRR